MSAVLSMASPASAWRRSLTWLVLLLALVLLTYREAAVAMVTIWERSETFAHAFLVPPIVLWLVWRKRQVLAGIVPRPQPWVLLPMAAIALLWLLGELVAVNAATQFALVAMLVLCVPAVLGLQVAWELFFPLVFTFFCVPVGEFMLPQLMEWTADFTVAALQLTGIPVYREGQQFVIPSGSWSVVEACSGVRYLIASFMVGSLFAYLNYRSWQRRVVFGVVSIVVPIVANWLRAYMIVMIGHLSGNKLAVGVDHIIYGWVFFGVVVMLMFLIGARWSEPEPAAAAPKATIGASSPQGALAASWPVALSAAVLLVLPLGLLRALEPVDTDTAVHFSLPDTLSTGWRTDDRGFTDWTPDYANPNAQAMRTYAHGDQVVGLYVAYYRGQDYSRKLVSSTNALVKSEEHGWVQLSQGKRAVPIEGREVDLHTAVLRDPRREGLVGRDRLLTAQTYWIGGKLTTSGVHAKLLAAWHRMQGRGDDSAVIIVYAPADKTEAAQAALDGFLQANLSKIEAQLTRLVAGQ